jgi:integrase/recombinase XerD
LKNRHQNARHESDQFGSDRRVDGHEFLLCSDPRLHDFRHRFAVQTLLRWYHNGEDPKRRLPILSTYLGHAHVTDTYWYLTGTPELLQAAGDRLEKRWEGLNAGLR